MVGPDWNHCLEYEFRIRKDALRRTEEDGLAIVANAKSEKDKQTKNTALENKVSSLANLLANLRNNRSRSPRKQPAITNKPWAEKSTLSSKGRGGTGRGRGKGSGKGQSKDDSKSKTPTPATNTERIQNLWIYPEKARSQSVPGESSFESRNLHSIPEARVFRFWKNAPGSTSASAVAKLVSLTTIAAAWDQQHEQSPLFLKLRLKTFLSLSK